MKPTRAATIEDAARWPAKKFEYADPTWKTESFTCPVCGWEGRESEMNPEYFDGLSDRSCPRCDKMLLVLAYPRMPPSGGSG